MEQYPKRLLILISLLVTAVVTGVVGVSARKPEPPLEVGLTEHLGDIVPGDLQFVSDTGDTVMFGDLVDRPTLLALVYYSCPSVCRPLLQEGATMLGKLTRVDMQPDRDYRILTVSFDQFDSPARSATLKDEYYQQLPEGFPRDAWTFLTGDSLTIHRLTEAVGFGFKRNANDSNFAHPTTLIVLSKDRKITRYLTGAKYLPLDIKMALVEANQGRIGATVVKFAQFCFSYDPSGQKFALNATRVVGLSTLVGIAVIVVFISASGRRRKEKVH